VLLLIVPPISLIKVDQRSIAKAPTINSEITGTDKPPTTPRSISAISTTIGLKEFAKEIAILYGLNEERFIATIQCESGFQADPPGNLLCRGISQYTLDTWLGNCSSIDERLDPYKSIECMAKQWVRGEQYRWDCYCFLYYDEKCIFKRGLYPK
jgi:hypothetical protein